MLLLGHTLVDNQTPHETGRGLLSRLYQTFTGNPLPVIAVTPRGKPYFPEDPLHFSITHTKHHVFCVLSNHPIGIDAEEMGRNIRSELAEKILSPEEYLRWQDAADPHLALLRLWVLKEAYYKMTGDGLRGYPNQTNFSPEDPRITIQHGCLVAIIEGD